MGIRKTGDTLNSAAVSLSPSEGERILPKISRIETMNPRAVSGSAGTLAGELPVELFAGKGAGAPGFMGEEEYTASRSRDPAVRSSIPCIHLGRAKSDRDTEAVF